jgi:hypothetical protein
VQNGEWKQRLYNMEQRYHDMKQNLEAKLEEEKDERYILEQGLQEYLTKLKELKASHRLMGQTDVLKWERYLAYDRAIREYDRALSD